MLFWHLYWSSVLHGEKSNYKAIEVMEWKKRILFFALQFDNKVFVVLKALRQFYFQEFESVEKE